MTALSPPDQDLPVDDSFIHLGLFYRDRAEYLAGMVPFVRDGLAAGEPVLVAVPGEQLALLQAALGPDADQVRFRDMAVAGRNPGRIIPQVLLDFVAAHAGTRVRIIGEPIWAGRTATEYPACVQHEALINVALAGHPATILCPYDATRLESGVLADAEGTHPLFLHEGAALPCAGYVDPHVMVAAFNQPLPEPPVAAATLAYGLGGLAAVRALVEVQALLAGLDADRTRELQMAVNEVATNTLDHTDGGGLLRIWAEPGNLVCEVRDSGHLDDPLHGRRPAPLGSGRGRGLLLVHALCDLVTVHTEPGSTAIRLHVATG
jgi:anti-sigma regulatory factor (Ser/Thr protein kinase)